MMDNPEEVLQALDEFQKLRPSEIPRELEEYLCWVAKTGDPVYQWSLIKVLFREKLLRVMTDFYESCPSLDLTPCPNVETFNYDNMKANLLERLENFANAPFTVQRICELLTTPRKEYNRIDKFMRAVEKNILVVSTKEPGSLGRRSENGDGLVNGSVEDETSHHGQSSHDVDMENWVKDCTTPTAAAATAVHAGEPNEDMLVDDELNTSLKNSFEKHDRIEHQLSVMDATASSFVTSTSDFQVATTMPPQVPASEVAAVVQNLAAISNESIAIIGDVSDAIMNEDTSSQPSLELESDDNDSNDSKKLQTTFQAKDFKLDDSSKSSDSESQDSKSEESIETSEPSKDGEEPDKEGEEQDKEGEEQIIQTDSDQKLVSESADEIENTDKADILAAHSIALEAAQVFETDKKFEIEPQISVKSNEESNECLDNFQSTNNSLNVIKDNIEEDISSSKVVTEENIDTSKISTEDKDNAEDHIEIKEDPKTESVIQENIQGMTDLTENTVKKPFEPVEVASEVIKPIVEEPSSDTTDTSKEIKSESTELTIQETAEDDTKTKTIVPDPIPIIEEPKDIEPATKHCDDTVSVTEEISEPQNVIPNVNNGLEVSPIISEQKEENQIIVPGCEEAKSNKESVESMDVDNEGLISSAQQVEPMEQEMTEAMNS